MPCDGSRHGYADATRRPPRALVPLALFLIQEYRIAGDARASSGRLVDPHAVRAQPRRGPRASRTTRAFPSTGSTAPLWTLLLASRWRRRRPPSLRARQDSSAPPAPSSPSILTRPAALAWQARRPRSRSAPASRIVGTGALTWGALSGMEVSLAAALVAGALARSTRGTASLVAAVLVSLAHARTSRGDRADSPRLLLAPGAARCRA